MNLNRKTFFDNIRLALFGTMSQSQVDGIDAILDYWEASGLTSIKWLSYMLATIYHETDKTMQPIEEHGKGKGYKYGLPDPNTGLIYYGRGFVQLTWAKNYQTMGDALGIDLYHEPSQALDLNVATKILFEGMTKGMFTGRSLKNYFGLKLEDPVGARRIINGQDKAALIAGYYKIFKQALSI